MASSIKTTCNAQAGSAGVQDSPAQSFANTILAACPSAHRSKAMSRADNRSSVSWSSQPSTTANCSTCSSRRYCQSLQDDHPVSDSNNGVPHCCIGFRGASTGVPDAILSSLLQAAGFTSPGDRAPLLDGLPCWKESDFVSEHFSREVQGITTCAIH